MILISRLTVLLLAVSAQPNIRGAQEFIQFEEITTKPTAIPAEDKLAYYEAQAKERFRDFRERVDNYVGDFQNNDTVGAITKNAKGFYNWAVNRDKWESIAIFTAVALMVYTILAIVYKILKTFCEVVCLPIRCLTCCCRRRRSHHYR